MSLHVDGDDITTLGSLFAQHSLCEGVGGPFFRAVTERCVRECRDHYGERLVAIYVFGSVHRGEAVPGVSDVDLCVFTRDGFSPQDAEWRRLVNDRLGAEFPPSGWVPHAIGVAHAHPGAPVSREERAMARAALLGIMAGVQPDKEASEVLRRLGSAYLLRHDATRLWGDDLLVGVSLPAPDALWAQVAFQCPWDVVRHAAGTEAARRTAFTQENVAEWGLPDDPALRLRKLARLGVLGGAYLLMARGDFVSYRAADVLAPLGRGYPEWGGFLERAGLLCTSLPGAADVEDYLRHLVPWMDWVGEQFPAVAA